MLSRWRGGKTARRLVRDALGALRPLVLPLLVVAVVAALNQSIAVQLVVGIAVAAILVPWLLPDRPRAPPPETDSKWVPWMRADPVHPDAWLAGLVFIPIGAAILVVLNELVVPDALDDFGGFPTAVALASLVVWGIAAALRLLGFGQSILRLLVSLFVLLAAARGLTALGVLPFTWDAKGKPTPTHMLILAAAAFGACVLLEVVWVAVRGARGRVLAFLVFRRDWHQWRLSEYGLGVAVSATFFVVMAFAAGWITRERASSASTEGLVPAAAETPRLTAYQDRALAFQFMPILRFDRDAQWTPRLVDEYLTRAELLPPVGKAIPRPHLSDLDEGCQNPFTDPCYGLTIRCPRARRDDGSACPATQQHDPQEGAPYHDQGAIYVRVARRGRPPPGEPNPFESFGPEGIRKRLRILVQYWLFYDYDEWVAPVLAGRIIQRHEGDWEAVTVGLARDRPLFVAYSQHCGGMWERWSDVAVADTRPPSYAGGIAISGPGWLDSGNGPENWDEARGSLTHPAVSVAVGSQANYPPAKADVAPNWDICQGYQSAPVSLLSYIWNIRDRTGEDYEWMPLELRLVDAHQPPMTFPGTWGAKDTFQYVTTHDDPDKVKGGRGPRTPTRQDLWRQPVFAIFCGEGWRNAQGDKRDYRC